MVSDHVVKLCCDSTTVSSELAKDPTVAPSAIIDRLYGRYPRNRTGSPSTRRLQPSTEQQESALKCGKWGPTAPSPLFLQAFADALNCLDADVQAGVVSPPLMGSHGTAPLTVIAPLADVIRHCANLIASAEREVFFVTCSWSPSLAQRLIRGALLELSRRAGTRNQRVKAHFMYDSAGLANLSDSHARVKQGSYTGKSIGLPAPDEIPNVDLEVMNLHTIPLGTLHSKFCVVDGKYAAIMSNNMADNDNMEMMVHLEGPIVESVRDTAIITWYEQLKEVPTAVDNAASSSTNSEAATNGTLKPDEALQAVTEIHQATDGSAHSLSVHMPDEPHFDTHIADEILRVQGNYHPKPGESFVAAANRVLNLAIKKPIPPTAPDFGEQDQMTPYIETTTQQAVPMALVSRPPYGRFSSKNANSFKARSCHIKLLIVDGSVGIQGSGNQDTQSWFHSQEVNVMVDSAEVCGKWRAAIDRNQNTGRFGRVADDGVWRDADGRPGAGYMGDPGPVRGLFKGVAGMFMKMEGLGGF
ncbi:hypothetical protein LLEC1_04887 [Akanthomyces lecanii]|uniref:PLD phosphodiesterase domain-containing protein n=1 Tax=Cordyceps confragosa TaxID=2714763 RepID=A0A179ICY0_CORDF|nr:hypothetical protein LLEC1_04887 [Akanthomyces lecanii]